MPNPYTPPQASGRVASRGITARGFGRLLIAFAGFVPLSALAMIFLFWAGIALFDPLAGASGSLARPPSWVLRLGLAGVPAVLSFAAFFLAALVARWGLARSPAKTQVSVDENAA